MDMLMIKDKWLDREREFGCVTPGWYHSKDIPDLDWVGSLVEDLVFAVYETGSVEDIEECVQELVKHMQVGSFCKKYDFSQMKSKIEKKSKLLESFADIARSHYEDLKKEKEQIAEEA